MKLIKVNKKDATEMKKTDSKAGDEIMKATQELERARAHLSSSANDLYLACKRASDGDLGEFPDVERKNITKLIIDKNISIGEIQKTIAASHKLIAVR